MSDPRYMIELSRRRHADGSAPTGDVFAVIGELNVGTTDPVVAADLRDELKARLSPDFTVVLYMVEESRSRVLAAMNEDHFRTRRDRTAGAALAVETPGAAPGYDVAMNEAAAALKALLLIDNYLCGETGTLTYSDFENIALSLEHYGLTNAVTRSTIRRGTGRIDGELKMALAELSTLTRAFPLAYVEPVDSERWLAVGEVLRQHNPDSIPSIRTATCEHEAELDFAACKGRVVEVTFVNGYDLGTNDQNDHVLGTDEAPYRVVVTGMDPVSTQWCDDDLDPKWDVRPAPDETRLDGLRSLWTFGPSYKVASASQQEG